MLKFINLKDGTYSAQQAVAVVEIEIERAKKEGVIGIKILHGYGSHGVGGVIMQEVRRALFFWKKSGFIRNYFGGEKWNLFDEDAKRILYNDKSITGDCDLGKDNPGISIVEV